MRLQFFVLDVVVNSIRLSDDNIYAQLKRIVQMAEERQAAGDVDHDEGQTDRRRVTSTTTRKKASTMLRDRQTDRRWVTSTTLRDRQTGGG